MLLKNRKRWELPEAEATPESVWMNRRGLLKSAGYAGLGLATAGLPTAALAAPVTGFPADRNLRYRLDRDLSLIHI